MGGKKYTDQMIATNRCPPPAFHLVVKLWGAKLNRKLDRSMKYPCGNVGEGKQAFGGQGGGRGGGLVHCQKVWGSWIWKRGGGSGEPNGPPTGWQQLGPPEGGQCQVRLLLQPLQGHGSPRDATVPHRGPNDDALIASFRHPK